MLIDDEQSVLTGLGYLIDWGSYDSEVCGAYKDPAAALSAAEELQPDLVITDIEMPGISGLDLIASMKETVPGCTFVVLSAYDNFRYAQESVRLGVFRYLLKPISAESLSALLMDVKKRQEEHLPSSSEERGMVRTFVIREAVLHGLELKNAGSVPYYRDLLDAGALRLAALWDFSREQGTDAGGTESAYGDVRPRCVFRAGSCLVFLLGPESDPAPLRRAADALGKEAALRISEPFEGLAAGHEVFSAMNREMQEFIFWGGQELPAAAPPASPDALLAEAKKLLLPAVYSAEDGSIGAAFGRIAELLRKDARSLSRQDIVGIESGLIGCITELAAGDDGKRAIQRPDLGRLVSCDTFGRMHAYALGEAEKAAEALRASDGAGNLYVIEKAKSFIKTHYGDPEFRLTDVADSVYMNYSYLSHVFKVETGKTMYSYLLDLRMRQAEKLLEKPGIQMSEVGLKVGYPNTTYFYSAFKKYHGKSPKSYRKQMVKKAKENADEKG